MWKYTSYLTNILVNIAENTYEIWLTVFSLTGKFAITTVFQLIWMLTIEMLPTKHRSVVVAEASVCGRVGSFCSPYIVCISTPQ